MKYLPNRPSNNCAHFLPRMVCLWSHFSTETGPNKNTLVTRTTRTFFCFGNHCDFCSFIVMNDRRICEAFTSNFPLCFNPVIKMSMATNYRYEVERPGAKNLRKALKRQEERIKVCAWQEIKGLRWDFFNWINFAYFLLGNYVKIKSIVRFILHRKR